MAMLLSLFALALFAQGELIDRVVAVVDGHVITLDQWQQQERFEALMQDKNPADIRLTEASLNRIIDNLLVANNRNTITFTPVTTEEVINSLRQCASSFPTHPLTTAGGESWLLTG